MKPIVFPEANKILQKPFSMSDGECLPLHVFTGECYGFEIVVSCWKPSWRERLSMLLFGRAWLMLVTNAKTQPPVAIYGRKSAFMK